jgi:hypothetical protein
MNRRILARTYREAARKIAEGEEDFSCNAAYFSAKGDSNYKQEVENLYAKTMRNRHAYVDISDFRRTDYEDVIHERVMALCFMAAIAETGDIPPCES